MEEQSLVDFSKLSTGSLKKVAQSFGIDGSIVRSDTSSLVNTVQSYFIHEMSKFYQTSELDITESEDEDKVKSENNDSTREGNNSFKELENKMELRFLEFCLKNQCRLTAKSSVSSHPTHDFVAEKDLSVNTEVDSSTGLGGKLKRKLEDEDAISDGPVLDPGTVVTAKVENTWLLGRVVRYIASRKRYKIEDADELASTRQPVVYDVETSHVIPLLTIDSIREGDKNDMLLLSFGFPVGEHVLGLFPGTSSFYEATVSARYCDEQGKLIRYGLQFEDDDTKDGATILREVDVLHVVAFRP